MRIIIMMFLGGRRLAMFSGAREWGGEGIHVSKLWSSGIVVCYDTHRVILLSFSVESTMTIFFSVRIADGTLNCRERIFVCRIMSLCNAASFIFGAPMKSCSSTGQTAQNPQFWEGQRWQPGT